MVIFILFFEVYLYFVVFGFGEGVVIVFKFDDRSGSFVGYVMNSVLVIELVGVFYCVVYVLFLVVFVYVVEGGVDVILGSDCVIFCGEEFGNVGSVEVGFSEIEGGMEIGIIGINNDCIVFMVL